jgi:hypothetical protein
MLVVIVVGGGKDAIVAAAINHAVIGAVDSIPLPPPLKTAPITTVNDHHCRCHTVNDDDRQKPAVIVRHQRQQWRSAATQSMVNGSGGLS